MKDFESCGICHCYCLFACAFSKEAFTRTYYVSVDVRCEQDNMLQYANGENNNNHNHNNKTERKKMTQLLDSQIYGLDQYKGVNPIVCD